MGRLLGLETELPARFTDRNCQQRGNNGISIMRCIDSEVIEKRITKVILDFPGNSSETAFHAPGERKGKRKARFWSATVGSSERRAPLPWRVGIRAQRAARARRGRSEARARARPQSGGSRPAGRREGSRRVADRTESEPRAQSRATREGGRTADPHPQALRRPSAHVHRRPPTSRRPSTPRRHPRTCARSPRGDIDRRPEQVNDIAVIEWG